MKKKSTTRTRLGVEPLERRDLLAADPIITEFMASNDSTILDGNGASSDWIEIYNNGDESVDLQGYRLTDDPLDQNKWQFPSTMLEPGEFLLVFASGDDAPDGEGFLHTNFSLAAGGEYLGFADPAGNLISEFSPGGADFPVQTTDVSYGLAFDSTASSLVTPASAVRYLVPSDNSVDSVWTSNTFNDASWNSGTASLGYENTPGDYQDLIDTDLPLGTVSAYVRIPFTVPVGQSSSLDVLQMRYDDGFIAYINGTRVASSNAPVLGSWNSFATGSHPDGLAVNFEDFDISQFSNLLVAGTNTLAIHMLNTGSTSSDFLASPNMPVVSGSLIDPPLVGTLASPTPGSANQNIKANDVTFSRDGGVFIGSFTLEMSTPDPTEVIRFTTNGTNPTASSPVYSGPINVSATRQFRAAAFGTQGQVGDVTTATYSRTFNSTAAVTSDLPIIVLENFQQGVPGTDIFQDASLSLFEPDSATGRTTLTDNPTLTSLIGMRRRGSSTAGNPKTNMRIELRDEFGEDQSREVLGMPAESDWILYAPYQFDRAMLRNTFIYDLSNQIGQYAVRTRFVEVYSNTDNTTLSGGDYLGVYVLMENIKRDSNRVDIDELTFAQNTEPEITGGYIVKIDRPDGEPDSNWSSSRGYPTQLNAPTFYNHVEPERADMTQQQVNYIRGYVEDFEDSLFGPNFTDPDVGYEAYLDVDSAINHHLMRILAKDPDALRLSEYFHKDRGGKLTLGPVWDFDRTMGPDSDGRAANPVGWNANEADFFGYDWWGRLFEDPNFTQRWVDRWQELRETTLSDANIEATINAQADQIRESQARNFQRWSEVAPNGGSFAEPGLTGWEGEVSHMIGWVKARAAFMDSQMVTPATFNPTAGNVAVGTQVTITPDTAENTIYYTLDGSDPRADGGAVAANAIEYTGPITVNQTTRITVRNFGTAGGTSGVSNSSYPSNENPGLALDGNPFTKYLNFGEENSGLIVTPGNSIIRSMQFTTANDAIERDPTSWQLYGTNDSITSADNSTGLEEDWTLIDSGTLNLPNARFADSSVISVNNSTTYSSYRLMFPTVKNAAAANSMQIGDIFFFQSTNGSGASVLSPGDDWRAVHFEVATTDGVSVWSQLNSALYSVEVPADPTNLRLTELHFHPDDPTPAELMLAPLTEDDDYEFVEFYNAGASTISLNGVQISDGITFDFTTGSVTSLAPGETVLIVEDLVAFEARYGSGFNIAGEYSGNLSNGGEQIVVVDGSGNTIHDFVYDDVVPWPVAADGDGPSMRVIDIFGDYSDPANWVAGPNNGTPGVYPDSVSGDFDGDGNLACSDINQLNGEAVSGAHNAMFDVTGDGLVDQADVLFWIGELKGTLVGDANLDLVVDASDFNIWNSNKFTANTNWCSGDFTSDGFVDASDFNVWNSNKFQAALLVAPEANDSRLAERAPAATGVVEATVQRTTEVPDALPHVADGIARVQSVDDYFGSRDDSETEESEERGLEFMGPALFWL